MLGNVTMVWVLELLKIVAINVIFNWKMMVSAYGVYHKGIILNQIAFSISF